MYNLLDYRAEGPVLHFTFVSPGDEEHVWCHAALADPLVRWFSESLRPLASTVGKDLSVDNIVERVQELAARDLMPTASIDWLGLALLANRQYAEAVAALAAEESLERERDCSENAILAERLSRISEEFSCALGERLRLHTAAA
jgi:hypothetical protein